MLELLHAEPETPGDTLRAVGTAAHGYRYRRPAVRAARYAGYSWAEIAAAAEVSRETVRSWAGTQ